MATLYAWTDIRYAIKVGDRMERKILKCGNEVDAAKLGLSKKTMEELVRTKAIRDIAYPVPPTPNATSPVQHYRKLARAIEENADDISSLTAVLPDIDDDESVNKPKEPTKSITATE